MPKLRFLFSAAVLGVAGAALAQATTPVTIKIAPQSGSGESGTATLSPDGNKTKVEISLNGQPQGIQQPANIHQGSCGNLDPKPEQGLENVVNGKSTTVVPISLQELLKGSAAINVDKSAQDLETYVACGDTQTMASSDSASKPTKGDYYQSNENKADSTMQK